MARPTHTHTLHWNCDMISPEGVTEQKRFATRFCAAEWDDPRDAAIWFALVDERAYFEAKGWKMCKPKTIQVHHVAKLSDCGLA